MSINVLETFSNPTTLSLAVEALVLSSPNHAVSATTNNAVSVSTPIESLSLSAFDSQINDDVIVSVGTESLSLARFSASVQSTNPQSADPVDATFATLSLSANAVSVETQIGSIPEYAAFATWAVSYAEASFNAIAGASSDYFSADYAFASGDASPFYDAPRTLWEAEEWAARTGTSMDTTNAEIAKEKSLGAQVIRTVGASRIYSSGRGVQLSRERGQQYRQNNNGALTSVLASDVTDQIEGFSFARLNELVLGTSDDIDRDPQNRPFYGRFTTRLRPVANLLKDNVAYHREFGSWYVDPIQGITQYDVLIDALVSGCYRFTREQWNWNTPAGEEGGDGANFMFGGIAMDALVTTSDYLDSIGDSIANYWPSTVLDGDWNGVYPYSDSMSFIANPWSNLVQMMTESVNYLYGGLEDTPPTIDTSPVPNESAAYFRVIQDHTTNSNGDLIDNSSDNNIDGFNRTVGEYMAQRVDNSGDTYAILYYRNSVRGSAGAYTTRDIQVMNVGPIYWTANRISSSDPTTAAKFVDWADLIVRGAVLNGGTGSDQKARNQQMYTIYNYGLTNRNALSGLNQ